MRVTIEQQERGLELINTIREKSWNDEAFKKELITNPVQTLNSMPGEKVHFSKNCKIIVEDQTDKNYIYLNIPRKINADDVELTDKQLEQVSGGVAILAALAIAGIVYSTGMGIYDAINE